MNKNKTSIYVRGGFSAAICLLLLSFLVMILLGIIVPRKIKITVVTESATAQYSGEELQASGYECIGKLKEGHTIDLLNTGRRTLVGQSPNTAEVTILDNTGADVTQSYDIDLVPGVLEITPRHLGVTTPRAEKIFDGTPLSGEAGRITFGRLVDGHTAEIEAIGEQTLVGTGLNRARIVITDENGQDMTEQYTVAYDLGELRVTPRKITIASANASKTYDGKPLTSGGWALIGGTLCSGHRIEVRTNGSQTMVGESENEIVYAMIWHEAQDFTQVDMTQNYEIVCYYGTLSVRAPR